MATRTTQVNGVPKKPASQKAPVKKSAAKAGNAPKKSYAPVKTKAHSVAGEMPTSGTASAYSIMASRIANRVAEMAESYTFVEKPKQPEPQQAPAPAPTPEEKRKPRKLEMRLNGGAQDSIAFSAPFLDNTLQKMLSLQNKMLTLTAEMSKAEKVDEKMIKEHASQSAELSRIIALICAEKARQGA